MSLSASFPAGVCTVVQRLPDGVVDLLENSVFSYQNRSYDMQLLIKYHNFELFEHLPRSD